MKSMMKLLIAAMLFFVGPAKADQTPLAQDCLNDLKRFPGASDEKLLAQACEKVKQEPVCISAEGRPIYHFDKISPDKNAKKILVFSLIHGDETPAGTVGRYWMERLEGIDPRNSWRVVPVLNPDGVKYKTRTNANKIDINRNFPTKDWESDALNNWRKLAKSNPRRFPGQQAASEPETKCALDHLNGFQPDFVVSVHTPLEVLDYDGPKVQHPPKFDYLPWKSLGNYPGSLGRYMWLERQTPVLTMELTGSLPPNLAPFEKLQDIIGTLVKFETSASEIKSKDDSAAHGKKKYLPVALDQ